MSKFRHWDRPTTELDTLSLNTDLYMWIGLRKGELGLGKDQLSLVAKNRLVGVGPRGWTAGHLDRNDGQLDDFGESGLLV